MEEKLSMEIFIPGKTNESDALKRTTHLAVSAHQDDIEFMAYDGIMKCFKNPELHFTGVVAADGRQPAQRKICRSYRRGYDVSAQGGTEKGSGDRRVQRTDFS